MITMAAWWGLGYAALLVAVVVYGTYAIYSSTNAEKAWIAGLSGRLLALLSALLLGTATLTRALQGHGWPFVSSADTAAGIALFMLLVYLGWRILSSDFRDGPAVAGMALLLLSYGLGSNPAVLTTLPLKPVGTLLSYSANLLGASLLALAAAFGLTNQVLAWSGHPRPADQDATELLVRAALLWLAISLAIDTWWLQEVGLGSTQDAQQAGIAIAWMIYFLALRLRASPRWHGWPWTALLIVGFLCTLPILIDAPWLELTIPI
jgi:hypothetical protein